MLDAAAVGDHHCPPSRPETIDEDHPRLQEAVATPWHRFLPDDVSLLDDGVVDRRRLPGPRQLTDIYLLALAVAHGARLVTLDKSASLVAVRGREKSTCPYSDTGDSRRPGP